jgi:hypothetical protein
MDTRYCYYRRQTPFELPHTSPIYIHLDLVNLRIIKSTAQGETSLWTKLLCNPVHLGEKKPLEWPRRLDHLNVQPLSRSHDPATALHPSRYPMVGEAYSHS